MDRFLELMEEIQFDNLIRSPMKDEDKLHLIESSGLLREHLHKEMLHSTILNLMEEVQEVNVKVTLAHIWDNFFQSLNPQLIANGNCYTTVLRLLFHSSPISDNFYVRELASYSALILNGHEGFVTIFLGMAEQRYFQGFRYQVNVLKLLKVMDIHVSEQLVHRLSPQLRVEDFTSDILRIPVNLIGAALKMAKFFPRVLSMSDEQKFMLLESAIECVRRGFRPLPDSPWWSNSALYADQYENAVGGLSELCENLPKAVVLSLRRQIGKVAISLLSVSLKDLKGQDDDYVNMRRGLEDLGMAEWTDGLDLNVLRQLKKEVRVSAIFLLSHIAYDDADFIFSHTEVIMPHLLLALGYDNFAASFSLDCIAASAKFGKEQFSQFIPEFFPKLYPFLDGNHVLYSRALRTYSRMSHFHGPWIIGNLLNLPPPIDARLITANTVYSALLTLLDRN